MLSIHFECVQALSINDIKTESTSPRPAVVLRSVGLQHSALVEWNSLIQDECSEVPITWSTNTNPLNVSNRSKS